MQISAAQAQGKVTKVQDLRVGPGATSRVLAGFTLCCRDIAADGSSVLHNTWRGHKGSGPEGKARSHFTGASRLHIVLP